MGKKKKRKIDWLNHFIGFLSVVLGVLLAFWLSNVASDRKERQMLSSALINIRNEVIRNGQELDSVIIENTVQAEFLARYLELVDDKMNILVSPEELKAVYDQYPDFMDPSGHGISLRFGLFQLSNVAWTTSQNVGLSSHINFDLAYQLAESYNTQSKLDDFDSTIVDDLKDMGGNKNSFERVLLSARTALSFAHSLRDKDYPACIKAIDAQLKK